MNERPITMAELHVAMEHMMSMDAKPEPTREELRRMVENRRRGIPRTPGEPIHIYVYQERVPMQEISRPLEQTERQNRRELAASERAPPAETPDCRAARRRRARIERARATADAT